MKCTPTAIQAHGHTHNKPRIGSVVITDYAYLLVWITIIYSCDGGSVHQREQIISEIIVLFLHWHALFISHTAGKQVHNVCMVLLLFTFQTSLNSLNCLYQELNLLYRYWMFATCKVLPFSPKGISLSYASPKDLRKSFGAIPSMANFEMNTSYFFF